MLATESEVQEGSGHVFSIYRSNVTEVFHCRRRSTGAEKAGQEHGKPFFSLYIFASISLIININP